MTLTPASAKRLARSLSSGLVPIAAPHNNCLLIWSFEARGFSWCLRISVIEINATISSSSLTTGNFPLFDSFNISFASLSETPSLAKNNFDRGVMNSSTFEFGSSMNAESRFEMIPSNFPPILPVSVTGKLENPNSDLSFITSANVASAPMHFGSVMNPFLNFLTFRTSAAWSSALRLEWMIPIPPCNAMAMAMFASVTVSIGLDTNGTCNRMFRVNWLEISTSPTGKLM
mmetsp:Transcript_17714/g.43218  ORF Transcript_17714/g.43218 Transcript_17714/m.43218 type:complete len:230 (+) Transcript_17714:964-1653(+)